MAHGIIESIINIVVSLICVNKFGIYGVLCGTIVALLYRTNDMILYAAKKLLKRSPFKTYIKWGTNAMIFAVFMRIFSMVYAKIAIDSYGQLLFQAVLVCIWVIPTFFIIGSIIDKESFRYCVAFFKKYINDIKRKYKEKYNGK